MTVGRFCGVRISPRPPWRGIIKNMRYPIKSCIVCGEEFELKPGKPGFANRCPDCSEDESSGQASADPLKSDKGANAARREAMRNLLYRKDS